MSRPVVLVTAPILIGDAERILREGGCNITFMQYPIDEATLIAHLEREPVQAMIVRGAPPVTRRVLSAAKDLRMMSKTGAGFDSVDIDAATELGIALIVTRGANADAVAEHTLALMLSLARELPRFDRGLRKGVWKDPNGGGRGFRNRTVAIFGYGAIGRRVAKLAAAFGAKIVVHSRSRVANLPAGMEYEPDFDRFLSRADFLSLHCPLSDDTRGVIGAREIALMKPTAYLINTSRGTVVDEAALIAALQARKIGGAGLDTYAVEPPDTDNPLFALDNVLVTPHVGSQTDHANDNVGNMAAENIVAYLRGEIHDEPSVMNPEVLEQSARRPRRAA